MPQFYIRVYKSWNVPDDKRAWSNEYEFDTPDSTVGSSALQNALDNIVIAEKAIHLNGVYFLRATISTWAQGAGYYNPMDFRTVALTGTGERSFTGTQAEDLDLCYWVRKQVSQGFNGKLFYRAVLTEADKRARNNLKPELEPTSMLAEGGTAWAAYNAAMQNVIFQGEGGTHLALIRQRTAPTVAIEIRPVTQLVIGGVTRNKSDHAYFDREGDSMPGVAQEGPLSVVSLPVAT